MTTKSWFMRFFVLLLILAVLIPAVCYFFLQSQGDKENREQALLIAGKVNDILNAELTEPVVASETIAAGSSLIENLQEEENATERL